MHPAASHPERLFSGYLRALSLYWPVFLIFLSILLSLHAFWQATVVMGAGVAFAIFSLRWKKLAPVTSTWSIPEICLSLWIVVEFVLYAFSSLRFNSDPILLWTLHGVLTYVFIRLTCTETRNRRLLSWTLMLTGSFFLIRMIREMMQKLSNVQKMDYAELSMFKNSYAAFDAANELAVYIFALLAVAIPLAMLSQYRVVRILSWCCITIMGYCIVISFSRGGYIGFFFFLLLLLIGIWRFQHKHLKRFMTGLVCSGAVIILAAIPIHEPVRTTALMNETISQQRSTESRYRMWETAVTTLAQHPWPGTGTYNFNLQYNGTHTYSVNEAPIRKVTSIITQIVTERGITGLILFSGMLGIFFYAALRVLKRRRQFDDEALVFIISMMAALVAICIREATMSSILFKHVFFHVVCIALSMYMTVVAGVWPSIRMKLFWKLLLVLPLLVLLLHVAWNIRVRGKVIATNQQVIRLLDKKQWEKARILTADVLDAQKHPILFIHHAAAEMACDADSVTWETLLACKGEPTDIVQELLQAADAEPRDETLRFAAGWYAAHQSDWSTANPLLAGATRSDSSKVIYPLCYGMVLEKQGKLDEALQQYGLAMFLDPDLCLSPFYREFLSRHGALADSVFQIALRLARGYGGDEIAVARFGALQYFAGNHIDAKTILTQVRDALPMLNRPYYYLGEIALQEGDAVKAMELWRLSLALSPHDHLVCARLGKLSARGDPEFSQRMFRRVRAATYPEPLFEKRTAMYRDLKAHPNATLSAALMRYISPDLGRLMSSH